MKNPVTTGKIVCKIVDTQNDDQYIKIIKKLIRKGKNEKYFNKNMDYIVTKREESY